MLKLTQGSFFLGMLHAGVGETHVHNLLAAINVPFVHHKDLKEKRTGSWEGVGEFDEKNHGRRIA